RQCAEIGMQAVGQSLTAEQELRRALLNGEDLSDRLNWASRGAGDLRAAEQDLELFIERKLEGPLSKGTCWEICVALRAARNTLPRIVQLSAIRSHQVFAPHLARVGLFDERDFFLGFFAYVAGSTSRVLGLHSQAQTWLETAEQNFGNTL